MSAPQGPQVVRASVTDPDGRAREQATDLRGPAHTEGLRLHVPDRDVLSAAARRAVVHRIHSAEGRLAERLDTANLPGRRHDVPEVAEGIRDVVAMEPGTRPRRLDIDPRGRRVTEIDVLTETVRRRVLA